MVNFMVCGLFLNKKGGDQKQNKTPDSCHRLALWAVDKAFNFSNMLPHLRKGGNINLTCKLLQDTNGIIYIKVIWKNK